jgi:hypothetical protein
MLVPCHSRASDDALGGQPAQSPIPHKGVGFFYE